MASKRYKKLPEKTKDLNAESIEKLLPELKKNCTTKFDESLDLSFQINHKQKKSEVNIRTVVNLPGGTGKKVKVAVVCEDNKAQDAKDAGADIVGGDEFVERIKNFKIRGSSGKLNIALDGLPDFPCIPEGDPGGGGDMHFTETIEEMEGAYDDWKRGQWSRNPYVDMCIPSKSDPTMAAPGKHYMSVFIQYVPFNLANGGWNEERKQEFGRHIVDCISEFSPNFKDLINHYEVRTPMDLDSEVGLTEGNIFQGELTMDQLMFNRPVPGYAQYRTPLKNMYICSSSTHPGGGVMGAPGANAAREVLLDMNIPQKGNYY